jgi:hypothetical protein
MFSDVMSEFIDLRDRAAVAVTVLESILDELAPYAEVQANREEAGYRK